MRAAHWLIAALAAAALHCDGGDTSDPAPDPDVVDWDGDGVVGAEDCNDFDAMVWRRVTAHRDGDRDGRGVGYEDVTCAGDLLPPGWTADGTDCDDYDARRWTMGEAYPDADGDGRAGGALAPVCRGDALPPGWSDVATDCAPENATRWGELPYLYVDADADGFTTHGVGVVCSGDSLPPGYADDPSGQDCDDADPLAFDWTSAFQDGDGDGRGGEPGQVCAGDYLPAGWAAQGGDCAEGDGQRWQWLSYAYVDRDYDGYSVYEPGSLCGGFGLPSPYSTGPGWRGNGDCDDADVSTHAVVYGYADSDTDGVAGGALQTLCTAGSLPQGYFASGGDCAPDDGTRWREYAYSYRDADGDGRFVYQSGKVCYGTQLPSGYATSTSSYDCDDGDASIHTDVWGYADEDGDTVGAGPAVRYCTAGALPADRVATGTDCAPTDPTAWQKLSYAGLDEDGDGFTTRVSGTLCVGAELPDPYRATAAGNDCEDAEVALWRWTVLYPDADGDGIGTPPREIRCLGETIPAGYSLQGWDEEPADPVAQAAADGLDEATAL